MSNITLYLHLYYRSLETNVLKKSKKAKTITKEVVNDDSESNNEEDALIPDEKRVSETCK